jgi:hypothetical protein
MTFSEVYALFNNNTRSMCEAFGVTRQSIQEWKKKDKIPLLREFQLKEMKIAIRPVELPSDGQ